MLERKPDYFIASNGRPAMESHWVNSPTPHFRSAAIPNKSYFEEMRVRNHKTVKCLNNLAIQNGRVIHSSVPQAPSSSKPADNSNNIADSRRCEISSINSTNSRFATRHSLVVSKTLSPVLLRKRRSIPHHINQRSTSTSSNTRHGSTRSLVVPVQPKCSKPHAQLDNRLSNQRSYDRNIFGFTQKAEQFVLPPLPT
ncbi:uncharacterized protein LOC126573406 [Anopheles aquasalis]|uniref:uncharacterized protein LOC126573406 n=1 Tax=Anopheles aquasalis TaxID=42839 RepID=UPI00215AA085|nr:uncharacterized protein LOC126573406 [Anopheles aquasalis]XP_050089457.1 uncharacterized protein LOC126573406 [Anopheles aquasalis]XP_050089458.1 uncharacterized protein LOC126573406 [Anopheles aquasalis]